MFAPAFMGQSNGFPEVASCAQCVIVLTIVMTFNVGVGKMYRQRARCEPRTTYLTRVALDITVTLRQL